MEKELGNLVSQNINVDGVERILYLPKGYKISVFARGFSKPRSFDFDNKGNIYLADKGTGQVMIIKPSGTTTELESGLRNIHGIDWYNNDLYVAEENQVIVYRQITENADYAKKEVLIEDLPSGGNHTTRTIAISPDEKLFVSVGSSCNVCEEKDERRAALLVYDLDGSNEEIFAVGLRNTVGFIFKELINGYEIWGVDNGRDLIGDDTPVEEVNVIKKGMHYGWPYCHGSGIPNPEYPSKENFCRHSSVFPTFEMQAHSAPLGLSFAPGKFAKNRLRDNLLITFHGSWNRTIPTGYKVVRIDTSDPQAKPVNFITGWLMENGQAWGRPVEIKFFGDMLFITDDRAGVIYKVIYN